jgi:hypothetical protein
MGPVAINLLQTIENEEAQALLLWEVQRWSTVEARVSQSAQRSRPSRQNGVT